MCMVWLVDKYKITFKLVINSRRISHGPIYLMPGCGPAVEKHCHTPYNYFFVSVDLQQFVYCD